MKRKLLATLMIGTFAFATMGCEDDARQQEARRQEQLMTEAGNQVGMPNIKNYNEKKLAKKIFELRDDAKLITYAYTQNRDGKYVYLGRCMGYGLPYSTQYTNPEQVLTEYTNDPVISMADPNGLYSPDGLSATWLILLDEETGEQSIIYAEPEIVVTQQKLPKRLIEEWSLPKDY